MRPLAPLCELAKKYSTDKGGRHNTYNFQPNHGTHEYTPSYFDLLAPWRTQYSYVLEIGVNSGNSLYMWRDFFPHAEIIGLDIDPGCLIQGDRIRCFRADQGDKQSLLAAVVQGGVAPFDLIIDDGSHRREHQGVSLQTLVPFLSDIGMYIVEDIARDDKEWHQYLLDHTPENTHRRFIYPEFKGTGTINDEILYVVQRKVEP